MKEVPLDKITSVLLDMDGTLLDKYFDDYFWEHLVPEKYADKNDITFGAAKEELMHKYRRHEGTLNWTDLEFWSRELGLDIPAMKEQVRHLIEVHPHVEEFLVMLRRMKKGVHLVTNAHDISIELKFKKTGIGKYFDSVVASCRVGHPKESLRFWEEAQKLLGFESETTLFVDDTEEVLVTAERFGIKYIVHKAVASSREEAKASDRFMYISDFRELMDG